MKRDLTKLFIDEIYSTPPRKNYPTNKIVYKHIDEIWSIDLADMIDYKISNNKGFRYIFIIIDNYSKYLWAIPLKNNYSQTITKEFSNILTTADIKKVFSKGDSTNYSYKLYTITEVIHDTIPSYRIAYLPERYNENLLLPTKLSLEENNKVMKELNLIQ